LSYREGKGKKERTSSGDGGGGEKSPPILSSSSLKGRESCFQLPQTREKRRGGKWYTFPLRLEEGEKKRKKRKKGCGDFKI